MVIIYSYYKKITKDCFKCSDTKELDDPQDIVNLIEALKNEKDVTNLNIHINFKRIN